MFFVTETNVAEAIEHLVDSRNCSVADVLKLQDALALGVLIGQAFVTQIACANQIIKDMQEFGGKRSDDHVVNQVSQHVSGRSKPGRTWIKRYCDALDINAGDYTRYKSDVLEHARVIASKITSREAGGKNRAQPQVDQKGETSSVASELQEIGANVARIQDLKEQMSSALDEDQTGTLVDGSSVRSKLIYVNIDEIGRNEALGIIANAIVDAAGVPRNAKMALVQINQKFRTSKAMLENFLGIESSGLDNVLHDYSVGTKKDKNDIDRLVSAGIDVNAIREYGEAAIDAAAEALMGSQNLDVFELKIGGDLQRRRLFVERLVSRSEKSGLLECLEIEEVEDQIYQEAANYKRTRLKLELISGLLSKNDFTSDHKSSSELVDFLTQEVVSCTSIEDEASTISWVTKSVEEVYSKIDRDGTPRLPLSPDEHDAYKLIFGFWATQNIQVLFRIVALYCRREGQVSTMLAQAIELVSQELSYPDLNYGMQISRILRLIKQVRSGVIEAEAGVNFFDDVLKSLPEHACFERSLCLYQASYFYFRMSQPSRAKEMVLKALELDGTNVAAICFRAVLEMQDDRFEIASSLLEEAQEIDNSYIFVPFYKGVLREAEGDYEEAIIEYIRSLILAPNFYEAALNLTNCLLDTGRILDATRWTAGFLSKYSVPSLEFHTNIAVSLFQAGYSAQALKMLFAVYAETPAPLVALNIGKIYFGRAQSGPCKDWMNRVFASETATSKELREAREIAKMVGKEKSIEIALNADLAYVERSERVGDALGILLASQYQLASGTNNDLFQTVRRAIQSKPRKAEKFAPKSVRAMMDAEARKAHDRKLAEQKRRYSEQIKSGRHHAEPKSEGRKRRKKHNKTMSFAGGISLTRAPSYSAG